MADGFDILGEIKDVEVIASGRGVRIRKLPNRRHGQGRWRKLKGKALVRLRTGIIYEAEIHWYEAHGIGRRDFKIKE
jgi:hypothetical protein